jgi:hypothetical protein
VPDFKFIPAQFSVLWVALRLYPKSVETRRDLLFRESIAGPKAVSWTVRLRLVSNKEWIEERTAEQKNERIGPALAKARD